MFSKSVLIVAAHFSFGSWSTSAGQRYTAECQCTVYHRCS